MKNNIKAVVYVVTGIIFAALSLYGIIAMYFSATFIPVYVEGTYVLANQIVRYAIYAILAVVIILSVMLAVYGMKFLIKRFRRMGGR